MNEHLNPDLRISVTAGATLNLGNYNSARIEVAVLGVDPAGDVAAQLASTEQPMREVADHVIERLKQEAVRVGRKSAEGWRS